MSQTSLDPVKGACQHMRERCKMMPSRKSPFPEKRFMRYECELGHDISALGEEDLEKCFAQSLGCWKEINE